MRATWRPTCSPCDERPPALANAFGAAPAGVEAAALHELTLVLVVGAAVVFMGVMLLLALALRRGGKRAVPTAWWVLGGGIAFPVVLLSALLLYSTLRVAGLERTLADPPLVVTVIGRQWWWEVRYRDPAGGGEVVLANELRLPAGRPAQIALASVDVIHSLWVPELGGKRDLVPGRTDHLVVTPLRAGVFRGECAEFWGAQHVKMALPVVVKPVDEFARWLAAQARPAVAATAERADAGTLAVRKHGCAACHTVGGVNGPARPGTGPHARGQPPDAGCRCAAQRTGGGQALAGGRAGLEAGRAHAVLCAPGRRRAGRAGRLP